MIQHEQIDTKEFKRLVKSKQILFGGNKNLKIYGKLDCYSGKRMKKSNRVFFESEQEATALGYRPCKNCMR